MRIVVPIKQVPETSNVTMDPETGTIVRSGGNAVVNPLDLYANQVRGLGAYRVIVDPKRQWYRIVEGVIREGRESGEFRTGGDPAEVARLFNRSIRSVFLDWCIVDGSFDLVEAGVRYCREWMIPVLVGGADVTDAGVSRHIRDERAD